MHIFAVIVFGYLTICLQRRSYIHIYELRCARFIHILTCARMLAQTSFHVRRSRHAPLSATPQHCRMLIITTVTRATTATTATTRSSLGVLLNSARRVRVCFTEISFRYSYVDIVYSWSAFAFASWKLDETVLNSQQYLWVVKPIEKQVSAAFNLCSYFYTLFKCNHTHTHTHTYDMYNIPRSAFAAASWSAPPYLARSCRAVGFLPKFRKFKIH